MNCWVGSRATPHPTVHYKSQREYLCQYISHDLRIATEKLLSTHRFFPLQLQLFDDQQSFTGHHGDDFMTNLFARGHGARGYGLAWLQVEGVGTVQFEQLSTPMSVCTGPGIEGSY